MARLHVLRVFCDVDGSGGNPLGAFLDGREIVPERRQAVAADLGLSETVFVDDVATGELRIFTPDVELPFAGHPTVGASWLLAHEGRPVSVLRPPAGEIAVRAESDETFVTVDPRWPPRFHLGHFASPAEVDALASGPREHDMFCAWAWIDQAAGLVRTRAFPVAIGIAEDEATGSASSQLCALLGRTIEIRQGQGSRILARPLPDGRVELGGRAVLDEVRAYDPPGG